MSSAIQTLLVLGATTHDYPAMDLPCISVAMFPKVLDLVTFLGISTDCVVVKANTALVCIIVVPDCKAPNTN